MTRPITQAIIGHRFVQDQGLQNLFPQMQTKHRAYKTLENELADWIEAGGEVKLERQTVCSGVKKQLLRRCLIHPGKHFFLSETQIWFTSHILRRHESLIASTGFSVLKIVSIGQYLVNEMLVLLLVNQKVRISGLAE